MTVDSKNLIVQVEQGAWMMVFTPFLFAAFAVEMHRIGINILWWAPPLGLSFVLLLAALLRRPREVVFCPQTQTMVIRFWSGMATREHPFAELEFIKSYVKTSGENDTYIQLAIQMKNGDQIAIKTEMPSWDKSAVIGLTGCYEPETLASLRRKIASLTGIEDRGFI
ncbi:MAG: hypothetical protein IPJ12_03120 [Betaproteobacteria bacterium]|nr:hypothetical protein [Betaproteobacteria bacterium]